MFLSKKLILIFLVSSSLVVAQLTPEQRLTDFQSLAAVLAKRYGPANWKQEAFGINLFDLRPWAERIRAAKSDIEFFQICSEFVANLRDGHSGFRITSSFSANLGLFTDLYEGKLLIESINRATYPADQFPFQVGDELVSIDGTPVGQIIDELMKYRGSGTERSRRRFAADAVVFRSQGIYPDAVNLPDESDVVIRRADSAALETYRLTWTKTGVPVRQVPPVPSPIFGESPSRPLEVDPLEQLNRTMAEYRTWAVDPSSTLHLESRQNLNDDGESISRNYILGWGARNPYYNPPSGFVVRRGNAAADTIFSGTYTSGGRRIGWIRIPGFAPANAVAAVNEFAAEIAFMKANTDGLVVDVSRNTGGGCIGLNYAQHLIPRDFYFFEEYLRPTQNLINNYEATIRQLRTLRAEQWVIDTYSFYLKLIQDASLGNRALTGPIPACAPAVASSIQPPSSEQMALRDSNGQLVAYEKPVIFLVDELSVSFGDIFPAMMQDNRRGPIVGVRTAGWGGSISGWNTGFYSESGTNLTNSLVLRNQSISAPGLPTRPYVENIGVLPDIELDFMTRENLLTRGRPFVEEATRIILNEIQKATP